MIGHAYVCLDTTAALERKVTGTLRDWMGTDELQTLTSHLYKPSLKRVHPGLKLSSPSRFLEPGLQGASVKLTGSPS